MVWFLLGCITGAVVILIGICSIAKRMESSKVENKRLEERCRILNRWLLSWMEEKKLGEYLSNRGIKQIIIYGGADLGKAVCKACSPTVTCVCFVDRDRSKTECMNVKVVHDLDAAPEADLIIITAGDPYREIIHALQEKTSISIAYLEDVLDEMYMG